MGSAGHPSEEFHTLDTEGPARTTITLAPTGAGQARPSPLGHAEDEGVLALHVRGLLLAAHGGEVPREEVSGPGEPSSTSPTDRMRLSFRNTRHLVAKEVLGRGENPLVGIEAELEEKCPRVLV
ncbi:hypothetical protein B5F33_04135 [Collinsella sp. An2]|nr:hypothetical protein B5F33_04135 [Collinsella sp. An2]